MDGTLGSIDENLLPLGHDREHSLRYMDAHVSFEKGDSIIDINQLRFLITFRNRKIFLKSDQHFILQFLC